MPHARGRVGNSHPTGCPEFRSRFWRPLPKPRHHCINKVLDRQHGQRWLVHGGSFEKWSPQQPMVFSKRSGTSPFLVLGVVSSTRPWLLLPHHWMGGSLPGAHPLETERRCAVGFLIGTAMQVYQQPICLYFLTPKADPPQRQYMQSITEHIENTCGRRDKISKKIHSRNMLGKEAAMEFYEACNCELHEVQQRTVKVQCTSCQPYVEAGFQACLCGRGR